MKRTMAAKNGERENTLKRKQCCGSAIYWYGSGSSDPLGSVPSNGGNIVFRFNIVTSLPKFLTGHNSRTNAFISWV